MSTQPTPELKSRLELAVEAAREAGALTLRHFRRSGLLVERKADSTPVTVADREAERFLRDRISAGFPEDGILGEEFPETEGQSDYRWILDPIDGTQSFIHGVPLFGTLVGVEHGGRSIIGVIVLPALDEVLFALEQQGAWHLRAGGPAVRAQVSRVARLSDGLFCTTALEAYDRIGRRDVYERMSAAASISRGWGDCYGYALVATGRAEVMIDPLLSLWDMAALQPILEEAGGTLTDWQGTPTIYSPNAVATNGRVSTEVLAITRQP